MSRTISTTLNAGITLSPGDNPVSITAAGQITAASGDAVYGYTTGVVPWTVANAGTIVDNDATGIGVHLKTTNYGINNSFTNLSGGRITSTHNGVVLNGAGVVINQANATIISTDTGLASGVYIAGAGTVTNSGLIQAGNIGVYELAGGSVTNLATGTISGAGGVYLRGAGTVTNAGTIIGTNAAYGAVLFDSNAGSSRLIVDPGAVFTGKIISLANSTNVVELASGYGTLSGFDGNTITNFATLQFDTGSNWTVKGSGAASGLGSIAITGFTIGDAIDLTGFVATSETFANNALVLTNASNAHTTLHVQGSFSSANFAVASYGVTGTAITAKLACFAEGTAIATPAGTCRVEALKAGDLVRTVSGEARPVRWIGVRSLDLTRHPAPERARPIRITAGAFADSIPSRDLRLSPAHAVLLDGVLIPVKLLCNDDSIAVDTDCRSVTYYHVELDTHDILLAEGLAAESYLDTGNRGIFQNADVPFDLHPTFDKAPTQCEAASRAPFAIDEARVKPVWERLAARSARPGPTTPKGLFTKDPAVRLNIDGQAVRPVMVSERCWAFALPPHTGMLRIASRSGRPTDKRPWLDDQRKLGVCIVRIVWHDREGPHDLPVDHPALNEGWWDVEGEDHSLCRWTDGDAVLPIPEDAIILEIHFGGGIDYRVAPAELAARPAMARAA